METTVAAPESAATTTTLTIPEYPRGGDPRRRLRLHYLLVQRRRISNALDRALSDVEIPADLREYGDWWHDIGMDLGYDERERAGRAA
jgi:hypothetical protein